MIHLVRPVEIMAIGQVEKKFLPENMQYQKWYPVIAEKTIKRIVKDQYKDRDREIEDLHFGIIDDMGNLQFVPQFNVFAKIGGN